MRRVTFFAIIDPNEPEISATKALTYIEHGKFAFLYKPKPVMPDPRDAVVRVTLGSICTSDLHIKHGFVNNCTVPNGGWVPGCPDF